MSLQLQLFNLTELKGQFSAGFMNAYGLVPQEMFALLYFFVVLFEFKLSGSLEKFLWVHIPTSLIGIGISYYLFGTTSWILYTLILIFIINVLMTFKVFDKLISFGFNN